MDKREFLRRNRYIIILSLSILYYISVIFVEVTYPLELQLRIMLIFLSLGFAISSVLSLSKLLKSVYNFVMILDNALFENAFVGVLSILLIVFLILNPEIIIYFNLLMALISSLILTYILLLTK